MRKATMQTMTRRRRRIQPVGTDNGTLLTPNLRRGASSYLSAVNLAVWVTNSGPESAAGAFLAYS
jgi:hypothetical protein